MVTWMAPTLMEGILMEESFSFLSWGGGSGGGGRGGDREGGGGGGR